MSHLNTWTKSSDLFRNKIRELEKEHGSQNWWPRILKIDDFAFEAAAGAMLTQNTAWKNVEKALACLAEKQLTDPLTILKTNLQTLERCVHASGYYKQKAKKLRALSKFAVDECGGDLKRLKKDERARDRLLGIWGVGPETADTILLYGLDLPYFVVDAYTRRLLFSLTGSEHWKKCPYAEVQEFCSRSIPKSVRAWQKAHAVIVEWGKGSE